MAGRRRVRRVLTEPTINRQGESNLPKLKLLTAAAVTATLAMAGLSPGIASASSHREAPLISQDPSADNTDVYFYRDVNNPDMVDIVANYIGLEKPAGGPNFATFANDVEYRININNSGSASDDIVYKFRFRTVFNKPVADQIPLFNDGPIAHNNDTATQSTLQTYSVERDDASGTHILVHNAPVPPPNIGPRSTPNYGPNYAMKAITALPGGGRVWAGPRKDAFYVDLGSIFDLLALRPLQSAHLIPNPPSVTNSHGGTNGPQGGVDGLAGMNVHAIVLQVPIKSLLGKGMSGVDAAHGSILGVYASAARQRVRVLSASGGAPADSGAWVQVSRLGLPLVNEVLIPIDQKDRWNATDPSDDFANGFISDIVDPIPVKFLPVLYPSVFNSKNTPKGGLANRPDLVALATGQLIGAPASGPGSQTPADLLRLNTAISPVAGVACANSGPGSRLGALTGDTGGFPNGRRLTDDIVDIELQVLAGAVLPGFGAGNPNHPSHLLTDGVNCSADAHLLSTFPYLGNPIAGYYQPLPGGTPG
jgi:hypothetical protein